MRKRVINGIVFSVMILGLFVSSKPSNAQYLAMNANTPANICKDTCIEDPAVNELAILSGKLGVTIDSTSDLQLMETLADWLGTPYRHAGFSKNGIDCSGFVSMIYKQVYGVNLTHSSRSMIYQMKEKVKKSELKEGDILFFRIHGKRISHVGIYLKDGMFIHASSNRGISVETLNCKYYQRAYYTAGRPNCNTGIASN
jgi:hypothetical protein